MDWVLVRIFEHCSWGSFVLGTERLYWGNCQEVGLRLLNCSTKSLEQSIDNRQGEPQERMECQLAFPVLVCSYLSADRWIFRIFGNFNLTEKAFLVGLSVWKFTCLVSGYISVCIQKDGSGWPIFHSDFLLQKLEIYVVGPGHSDYDV